MTPVAQRHEQHLERHVARARAQLLGKEGDGDRSVTSVSRPIVGSEIPSLVSHAASVECVSR